ncbi:MAG: flagellar motor protein MotB [Thermodesulfobacteriota bacterium]|nr:flagellar motor protein MotB [Thermodesulfobacteriota bacterium]
MRKRTEEIEQENQERWLLTYADLITLLLAFFIVLYTMSQSDAKRFEAVSTELRAIFSGGQGILPDHGNGLLGDIKISKGPIVDPELEAIQGEIKQYASEKGMSEDLTAEVNELGLIIRLKGTSLFQEGETNLTLRSKDMLDHIARKILPLPNQVRVEGHTDNKPIYNDRFHSNWELSVSRATEVVRYFVNTHGFPPLRVSAMGYGEHRPLVPNDSDENRGKNRRVEIVLLSAQESFDPRYRNNQ